MFQVHHHRNNIIFTKIDEEINATYVKKIYVEINDMNDCNLLHKYFFYCM